MILDCSRAAAARATTIVIINFDFISQSPRLSKIRDHCSAVAVSFRICIDPPQSITREVQLKRGVVLQVDIAIGIEVEALTARAEATIGAA